MAYAATHPSERFWSKVDKRGPDECWEWTGALMGGYGFLHAGALYEQGTRWVKAHRLSWEIHSGQLVPDGRSVLHHCDNPPCVNPAHLYVGTRADNARDRSDRRRGREHRQRGEQNLNAKLKEADVRAIIVELQRLPRRSQSSIAEQFGVKQPLISRIMRRQNWAHLWDE